MKKPNYPEPPLPRHGEILRFILNALDLKSSLGERTDALDKLARGESFNARILDEVTEEAIVTQLAKSLVKDQQINTFFPELMRVTVQGFFNDVARLANQVGPDCLRREEAVPLLIEHLWCGRVAATLMELQKGLGGPNVFKLCQAKTSSVAVVLDWAGDVIGADLVANAKANKTRQDQLLKWLSGKDIPSLSGIKTYCREMKSHPELWALGVWLIIARALATMEKAAANAFPNLKLREILAHEFQAGVHGRDVRTIYFDANMEAGKRLSELHTVEQELERYTHPTNPKTIGDKDAAKQLFDKIDELLHAYNAEHLRYWRDWQMARWHVLSGDLEKAIPFYVDALSGSMYRSARHFEAMLKEGLTVAAVGRKRVALKQIKAMAAFRGVFGDGRLQNWEEAQFAAGFSNVFPLSGMYPGAKPIECPPLHLFMFEAESLRGLKPNLRKPDRIISLKMLPRGKRRYPQLVWYASEGKADELAKLLEAGANVNKCDENGGSALLCALQAKYQNHGDDTASLLLKAEHAPKTLNTRTQKRGLTPLMLAIQHGDVETVERLLSMGASANYHCNFPAISPLYYCVGNYDCLTNPEKVRQLIRRNSGTAVGHEILRRYMGALSGVLGDRFIFENARFEEIEEMVLSHYLGNLPYTTDDLDRIVALLLEHGANPNEVSTYPDIGYTPLMLAAESNAANAFRMMLKNGGDPEKTNRQGNNSWRIAIGFASTDIYPMMQIETDVGTLH